MCGCELVSQKLAKSAPGPFVPGRPDIQNCTPWRIAPFVGLVSYHSASGPPNTPSISSRISTASNSTPACWRFSPWICSLDIGELAVKTTEVVCHTRLVQLLVTAGATVARVLLLRETAALGTMPYKIRLSGLRANAKFKMYLLPGTSGKLVEMVPGTEPLMSR